MSTQLRSAKETEEARFAFGQNWRDFASSIEPEQFESARQAMVSLLGTDSLKGRSFLDIGSGSGLMALTAYRLGADVTAFDYDQDAVETTTALRDRYAKPDAYRVMQGSVLDEEFIASLGTFDIVYSWGVLHHTGDVWTACGNAAMMVNPSGTLAVALYNDQGMASRAWKLIKRAYVTGGPVRKFALVRGSASYFAGRRLLAGSIGLARRAVKGPSTRPRAQRARGMDRKHDLIDWVGGYPFEVSTPEQVFNFFHSRGFSLEYLTTCGGGLGCNQFVFHRGKQA